MGKHNFENIRKQAYLLVNGNLGWDFDCPRLHHFLLGNREILIFLGKFGKKRRSLPVTSLAVPRILGEDAGAGD